MTAMAKNTQPVHDQVVDQIPQAQVQSGAGVADGLDLSRLRISQDFSGTVSGKKLVTTIPLRKPGRFDWIRVHPEQEWRMSVWTLTEERETFVVAPDLAAGLPSDVVPKELVPTITRQGTLTLWPLRLPGPDGRIDGWSASAREAANRAIHKWVRVAANMELGAYEVFEAVGTIPEPSWPDLSFNEMLRIAVKGRVIDSSDHPILKKLRGEM